jgi:predicted  nucleic acid-binding Zn-ribbon protein
MFSASTPEYDRQFLTLERKIDPITSRSSKPFIQPNEVQPDGKLKPLTQAEEVLNWQSENLVAQNDILQNLDKRIDKITEKMDETDESLKVLSQKMQKHYRNLKAQVSQLDHDLRKMLEEKTFGKNFDQKEREIKRLQGQVKEIDDFLKASKDIKPKPIEDPLFNPPVFPTYFTQPERPSPFYPSYASSPPDYVKYIPTAYRPKSARTTTSSYRSKGKTACLSVSSSDSQDVAETPPKFQKEEIPDKGFQAMAITENWKFSQESGSSESSTGSSENSSPKENYSFHNTSTSDTSDFSSSEREFESNYMNISRSFMVNVKEEGSFYEESLEETQRRKGLK